MNYISLGYFCSIASELERYGLRDSSFPFDWLISDFCGVISAIENHFEGLWNYELWLQNARNRNHYMHIGYGFQFYHDFDKFHSFSDQLPSVKEKYNRRISRFYSAIHEPTLFIRYISDEHQTNGVSSELLWIEENQERIVSLLKSFNSKNEILYIANKSVISEKIHIYHVEKDTDDTVARFPFQKNSDLNKYFEDAEHPLRDNNLKIYSREKRKKLVRKAAKRVVDIYRNIVSTQYCHERVY